jgi:DNA-binding NtrC family response regulator
MKKKRTRQKQTVLIIEDEKDVLEIIGRLLKSEGYNIIEAETGAHAVYIAGRIKPDVVILDLNLPDYNGIRLLEELKAMDKTIQVIILTAHGTQEAVRSAMELGAYNFLTKPFEFPELCESVREAFEFKNRPPNGVKSHVR